MGDIGVERVGIESTLAKHTPSDPIKTTHELDSSNISNNFREQQNDIPCSEKTQGITAIIMDVMTMNVKSCHSSKKIPMKKLIRVLLDTGSDGVLLLHEKETTKKSLLD
jgi:hypothetical protein